MLWYSRGFGGPEAIYAAETIVEHLAHESGLDPMTIREANLTREGDLLHFTDRPEVGVGLGKCWEEALKRFRFHERREKVR